jgi:type II secretory pathway pseudopilin PulG
LNSARARRGFTYVEALVALALLALGVTALAKGMSAVARSENILRDAELGNRLARQKLDELTATGEWQSAETGAFEAPYSDYDWRLTISDTGVTDLRGLSLTVTDRTGKAFRGGWAETLLYSTNTSGVGP